MADKIALHGIVYQVEQQPVRVRIVAVNRRNPIIDQSDDDIRAVARYLLTCGFDVSVGKLSAAIEAWNRMMEEGGE